MFHFSQLTLEKRINMPFCIRITIGCIINVVVKIRQIIWAFDNVRKRVQKLYCDRNRKLFKHTHQLADRNIELILCSIL